MPPNDLLRIVICGSVDDGKSTLIGRLLVETGSVPDDMLEALARDSRRFGTTGGDLDYALLVDGLAAEREQGITIDVAYRYMATPARAFIIADTPGHVQYTRNMATGASQADLAVLLVDASQGLLQQTRRHASIARLLGIRAVLLAVNKMDRVGFAQATFEAIAAQFASFAAELGIDTVTIVPVVARDGDNLTAAGSRMPWYRGPTVLNFLETVPIPRSRTDPGFRMPVQWVSRPDSTFRGYAGTVATGRARPGDEVVVLPAGRATRLASVHTFDGEIAAAAAGDAVTLVLADDIDVSRGDVIAGLRDRPMAVDQFAADIVWMGDEPLLPGRPYLFKSGTRTVSGFVSSLRHQLDVDSLGESAARQLETNGIGLCHVSLSQPVVFEPYATDRTLGSFIVIDKTSRFTVGAGMIRHDLRRASHIHRQALTIDRGARAAALGQRPLCIWFTGLSGAGKSTIANGLEQRLHAAGRHTYLLDGDNVRHGLNRDLGFTDADRVENIRRVGEVSRLMVDAGLIVLVAFISPFRAERQMVRDLFRVGEFVEVFVDAPIEVCEARDVKGLYAKARSGALKNFTGIDSPYEPPTAPEVRLVADGRTDVESLVDALVSALGDAAG